jgi:prevent-host-death family protein
MPEGAGGCKLGEERRRCYIRLSLVWFRELFVTVVNIHAAKTHLSRLVDAAAAGEEIIIAKAGKPVAKLVALDRPRQKRVLGVLAGKLRVSDDFDAPLPEEILREFEGG